MTDQARVLNKFSDSEIQKKHSSTQTNLNNVHLQFSIVIWEFFLSLTFWKESYFGWVKGFFQKGVDE